MKVVIYEDEELERAVIIVPAYNDVTRNQDETDDQLLQRLIRKVLGDNPPNYSIVEDSVIPSDRTNRDDWHYEHESRSINIG